mmetsp:Transcript_14356/g.25247  ORF Transcript_14356/g.25247 Transcript_14356/m.25247 type:complete len:242 (-) Transcript_14356:26-751(-)
MSASVEEIKARKKFSSDGRYLRFPGLTVVCDMQDSEAGELGQLPKVLHAQPCLGRMMSPLPPESYHVTLLDICCQYKLGMDDDAWSAKLQDPCWAALAKEVEEADFRPTLRVQKVTMWSGGIGVVMESAEESTAEHPGSVPLGKRMASFLGIGSDQKHPWHFTLAYCPQPGAFDSCDPNILEAERQAVEVAVKAALPDAVTLAPARLCRFESMEAFVPWDGLLSIVGKDVGSAENDEDSAK